MSTRSWLCEDAYIVAQRLQIMKKRPRKPTSSSKPALRTFSTPACLGSPSAPGAEHEGSTFVLYRPQESATGEQVSIIYNNCMCWSAVREEGTRTLVLRNLILSDADNTSSVRSGFKFKSSGLHSEFQRPNCSIDDLQLTIQDHSVPDKVAEHPPSMDRVHASAIAALHARQLIASLSS